jgi:hypothetical protein
MLITTDINSSEFYWTSTDNGHPYSETNYYYDEQGLFATEELDFRPKISDSTWLKIRISEIGVHIYSTDMRLDAAIIKEEFAHLFEKAQFDKCELSILTRHLAPIKEAARRREEQKKNPNIAYNSFFNFKLEDNGYKLENGKYIYNSFGKYGAGISFILPADPEEAYLSEKETIALWKATGLKISGNAHIYIFKGSLFTTRKGKQCFEIKSSGNQLLIACSWSGNYECDIPDEKQFYKRTRSNGGGQGIIYFIIDKNYKHN